MSLGEFSLLELGWLVLFFPQKKRLSCCTLLVVCASGRQICIITLTQGNSVFAVVHFM